ncbi:carbohydrate ABC transporter permease [Gracilibacillus alcaliphilus]|uniref:carbohydrate ABC transporter permease n=1 Tax=Gracilibacillus alcaliphilus TaxID=1401441 RepID=UPI00195EC33B|nr:sugar ABC transporter permease [Gracilibacillus alcaliphilus]MBM7677682.1 multiple sugar transport system permease protein [Gracilibacillus alcaliphilus]
MEGIAEKHEPDKTTGLAPSKKKKSLSHLVYIGPHLILFLIFGILPLIYGIYVSFTRWDLVGQPEWVGLANYKEVLFNQSSTFHSQFFNGVKNTLIFVVISVPLLIIIPLIIALALNTKVKAASLFQSIFYIPGLFSISAVALIWLLVFNKRLGPINNILGSDANWFTSQPHAWLLILVVSVWWGIGGNLVIYRAALSSISKDMFEAADIDGAGSIKKFFYITIPSIKFPILYTLVMTTLASFNIYGQPVMLTNGGPTESTTVAMMYIRNLAFGSGQSVAGVASAMAMLLGIIMVIVSIFQFVVLSKDDTK